MVTVREAAGDACDIVGQVVVLDCHDAGDDALEMKFNDFVFAVRRAICAVYEPAQDVRDMVRQITVLIGREVVESARDIVVHDVVFAVRGVVEDPREIVIQ